MTEGEWLAATDLEAMLYHVRSEQDERKKRLFGCACARDVWDLLIDERSRNGIEVSERFADGEASSKDLESAIRSASDADQHLEDFCLASLPKQELQAAEKDWCAAELAWKATVGHSEIVEIGLTSAGFSTNVKGFLRCIFGNPFRPVTPNPSWLTPTVHSLANGIYTERAFDRMPILADALQDAGCDNEDILNHCRQPGGHACGCWVVDLLLDKK